ncbi:hypothetical protein V7S43_007250 [Phytophthora oleae]|uniref:EF-hand domain-containing protein n=1 Tax=Phytophthora oleae TaxID=2107226 RepID=A0ABD3FLB7_9STRA
MDPRVSTAPTPSVKRWVPKNSNSTCLLRQPSLKGANASRPNNTDTDDTNLRPATCPVPTLTPQFHWNLNNSALKTLAKSQIEELYGLFQFYDSSAVGDDLPSINCSRLIEILRDARLMSESTISLHSIGSPAKRLQLDCVERIFAQAVMGQMRVYLDADGQPALTFPLFCGALMNCAMSLTPLAHPEAALRQILPILLDGSIVSGHQTSLQKGLLGHIPTDGTISLWTNELRIDPPDFRVLPPFQQVIADCKRDETLDELKQDKLARNYEIPSNLLASFHQDMIALITNKFRMFDVFDRGLLPRQEIFPLLSSLGKRADLPDPYAVLASLSASRAALSDDGGLTLAQLLQAIMSTREVKRNSVTARLGAMRINNAPRAASKAQGDVQSLQVSHVPSVGEENMEYGSNVEQATRSRRPTSQHLPGGSKERVKKLGMGHSRSRKSINGRSGNISGVGSSSHALLNTKQHASSKVNIARNTSVSGKKKGKLDRKPSRVRKREAASPDADSHGLRTDSESLSHRSTSSSSTANSSSSCDRAVVSTMNIFSPGSDDSNFNGRTRHLSSTVQDYSVAEDNGETARIFLLLGGDHDGAICCTLLLKFSTREIVESEGIYYSNAPCEITRTTPVLPTQRSLTNALLMLKKCVSIKQECGFELRPTNQLDAVDEMLYELKRNQPHFIVAKSPVRHTLRTITSNFDVPLKSSPHQEPQEQLAASNYPAVNALGTSASSPALSTTTGQVPPPASRAFIDVF